MSLPTNRIKKVKLPDNTEYEIIPEKMQSSGYQATLPNLSADDTIVTINTNQFISGNKSFSGDVIFGEPIKIQADSTASYTSEDWDTDFYPDRLEIENYGDGAGDSETFTLQYPKLADGETATLGLQIDIEDLTQINS